MATFKQNKELDCSYGLENVARFLNIFLIAENSMRNESSEQQNTQLFCARIT